MSDSTIQSFGNYQHEKGSRLILQRDNEKAAGEVALVGVCAVRIGGSGVSQASLVIIRHAPRIVQDASQAMMTQTATVADSGSSDGPPPRVATPPVTPGSAAAIGSPDGSRRATASPTIERCRSCRWGMSTADRIGVTIIWNTNSKITGTVVCPISEASPSPTVNVTIDSSSIHSPASIMRESGGERKMAV